MAERELIRQYFLKGSISEEHSDYSRILVRRGIIESVGRPRSVMSEALFFFTRMVREQQPLEILYRRMPGHLETPIKTLCRIFNRVVEGRVRRQATALFITPEDDPERALIGQDISTPRPEIGKQLGFLTIPATFSSKNEDEGISLCRVAQQEVFTEEAIAGTLPLEMILRNSRRLQRIRILDVDVALYHLPMPRELIARVNSPKIKNFQLAHVSSIIHDDYRGNLRAGMKESAQVYENYLRGVSGENVPVICELNRELGRLTKMAPSLRWA